MVLHQISDVLQAKCCVCTKPMREHCNIATHWLGAYTKWSLVMPFHWLLYLPWRPWCEQTNSQHIIQTYVKIDKFSQLSYHYYGNPFTWIDRLYIEIGFILKKHPKHHILWAKAFFTQIVVHNTCRKIDFLIMDVIWCIYVSWICINDYLLHIYMIICFITDFLGEESAEWCILITKGQLWEKNFNVSHDMRVLCKVTAL